MPDSPHIPTVEDVDRVPQLLDPILRNLHVTQGYHEVALAFDRQTGTSANWCSLATWASKQAGQSIRAQDVFAVLKERLAVPARWTAPLESINGWLLRKGVFNPNTRWGRVVQAVPGVLDVFERTSEAVSRGNIKVFEEIAREFARFLALSDLAVTPQTPGLEAFLASLKPGDPPGGQDLLRRAFSHYALGAVESDPTRRAQWIYLANLEIGLHEQTRLQPEITESLDTPSIEAGKLGHRILAILAPGSPAWWSFFAVPVALILGAAAALFAVLSRRLTRRVVTEHLMMLHLPERTLILSEDLNNSPPPSLARLDNPELLALLARFFPEGIDTGSSCAATDWSSLDQRMRYIARLFRAIHDDPTLRRAPFTQEQVWQLQGGVLPTGAL